MRNIDKYRKYTKERNWSEIFKLNDMDINRLYLGGQENLTFLADYLEENEVVFAIASSTKGFFKGEGFFKFNFVVLSSERFLILTGSAFNESITKVQSIFLNEIQAVEEGWNLKLKTIGDNNQVIKAGINVDEDDQPVFVYLANRLLGVHQEAEVVRDISIMENIDKYRAYTRERNWSEIFKLNNTNIDQLGTRKEMEVLAHYLEEEEVVFALVSGIISQSATSNLSDFGTNTWIAMLTSERVLCLDHALFSSSVDTQSIRLNRIQAVSSSQGWIFGKISIDIGNRMIIVDNCIKSHVPVFAELANQLLREQELQDAQSVSKGLGLVDELKRLGELKAAGIINEEEFDLVKQRIIKS